jgi:hypothetical protein
MPGTGPGLSIDDDVVRNYMIVLWVCRCHSMQYK